MESFGKSQGKGSAITCCMVTCFIIVLGGLACRSEAQEVNFTTPPENTTGFRGSDVTISCGHVIVKAKPVTWIINGTSFDQEELYLSPLYQQNNNTTPIGHSLTVFSINGTTTFQCIVLSTPNKTSTLGTVTVIVYNESTSNDGGGGGGSSIGAIAGGAIGGIVVVIVIIIIIIVVCYFVNKRNKESAYDDTTNLKSPTGTGGTHALEGDTNVITTDNNAQYDKVVYAAPVRAVNIPHQAAASGEQYAVSTKSVSKTNEEQLPSEYVHDTKKDTQGITYADLQELPTDSKRNTANQQPEVAYSQIA